MAVSNSGGYSRSFAAQKDFKKKEVAAMPKFPPVMGIMGPNKKFDAQFAVIEQAFKKKVAFSPDTPLDIISVREAVFEEISKKYELKNKMNTLSKFWVSDYYASYRYSYLEDLIGAEKNKRWVRQKKMEKAGLLQSVAPEAEQTVKTSSAQKKWTIITVVAVVGLLVFFLTRKKK